MEKILAVARAEYLQAVRSKAFVIGVLLMPVMMAGSILTQLALEDQTDLTDRRCAVYDATGELYDVLAAAATARNEHGIWEDPEDGGADGGGRGRQKRPRFLLERYEAGAGERPVVALSRRVATGELFGFLSIAPDALEPAEGPAAAPLAYHTENPTFTELPTWLSAVVNEEVRRRRFEEAQLDQELVSRLSRSLELTTYGLAEEHADGTVEEAEEEHEARTFGVPAASMFLLFLLVFTSAPQLMNQVLEEKMQRISEVLVSAVTPFQLMMGKLVGSVLVSMTLAFLYLGAAFWATHHYGVEDFVPLATYAWLPLCVVLALFLYGSLFSALGAACSELRDAQSMMMPALILIMIPLFAWTAVLESPNGTVATVLTFVPTATPMVLLLRVLAPPGPPLWEVLASLVACAATCVVFVWAGAKIFRVGILSQGQPPTFRRMLGWVLSK